MSNLSNFYGGKAAVPLYETILTANDATFTVSEKLMALVYCIGGGGGGGAVGYTSGWAGLSQGGSAGGCVMRAAIMIPGVNYAIVVGGGGAGAAASGAVANTGTDGGDTTFISGDGKYSITALGGPGGVGQRWNTTGTKVISAQRVSGSGGSFAFNGGSGGIIDTRVDGDPKFATGGGALNIYGFTDGVVDGGDIVCTSASSSQECATGGGGVRGRGGDLTGGDQNTTGGGGSGGAAVDGDAGAAGVAGVAYRNFPPTFLKLDGAGGAAAGGDGGDGAGGGGGAVGTGGAGGTYFGGGGSSVENANVAAVYGAAGGYGAGGGGCTAYLGNFSANGGAGGGGLVILQFYAMGTL